MKSLMATFVATALSLGMLLGLPGGATAEQGATMRIDPASTTVDVGQTFTVTVTINAPVATTGAQTNLLFDPSRFEVVGMEPGPAWSTGLFLYGNADDGSNASVEAALAKANETGVVSNVATFLLPGSGSVPPGEVLFLTFTMQATRGDGSVSRLELRQQAMLDDGGNEVPSTTTGSTVIVRASTTPSGGGGTPSAVPTPTPAGQVEGTTSVPTGGSGAATVTVAPSSSHIDLGSTATVDLKATTDGATSGAVADLAFDTSVLEITKIEPGPAWNQATLLAGTSGQTVAQAIAQANESGELKQAGVLLPPGSANLPSGESVLLSVTVKGLTDGTSDLKLTTVNVLGPQGESVPAALASARLVVGTGGGGPNPLLIAGLIVLVVAVGGGLLFARSKRAAGS